MEETSSETPKAASEIREKITKNTLVLAGAIILGAFIVAGAVTSTQNMNRNGSAGVEGSAGAEAPVAPESDGTAVTSLDDDPVLGKRDGAKVAIVEFSDFECPFCKRFHAETAPDLMKEYVESGQAIYSFRDYPLSFHEPNASLAAGIATCIGKAKGDSAYFSFSKAYFTATESNGKGIATEKLDEMIRNMGGVPATVRACAETKEIKDEIAKDMADGQTAGVSGTPSFIIGTIGEDGTVTGERIVGALPLSGFKSVIDKYLAE